MVASGYHTLVRKSDGSIWAWGYNDGGQIGDGSGVYRPLPVKVSRLEEVVELAAGTQHSLARKGDGTVWAWGVHAGSDGSSKYSPQRLEWLRAGSVRQLASGDEFSAALTINDPVVIWGKNTAVSWDSLVRRTAAYRNW